MPIHNKNDLKNNIQEYLNLKKIENEYTQEISKLKQSYDVIENNIVSYMNSNDYLDKEIIFEKNKLKCSNTKTSETITKKYLLEKLKLFLKNEEAANQAVQFIYSSRKETNKLSLKVSDIK